MGKFNCFSIFIGRKKKDKVYEESSEIVEDKELNSLQFKIDQPLKCCKLDEMSTAYISVVVPVDNQKKGGGVVEPMSSDSPVGDDASEVAYEGEDEHDGNSSIKRDFSDFDLGARDVHSGDELVSRDGKMDFSGSLKSVMIKDVENISEKDAENGGDIQTGNISDPGNGKAELWPSPELKRSCSNLELREVFIKGIADQFPPSKSQSFEELQKLAERMDANPNSPRSVTTHCSADKVMLKKHSSSQVLPSRSRRLWWKFFLWSHRNLHKPSAMKSLTRATAASLNQHGGYSSDTFEPNRAIELCKMDSPGSFTEESKHSAKDMNTIDKWDVFHGGVSDPRIQNQWVAFAAESSSFARVNEWMKDLDTQPPLGVDNVDNDNPQSSTSPARIAGHLTLHPDRNLSDDLLHASSIIRSLNSSSTVAHISGVGLKLIPTVAGFSSLRSVNLSSNFIVHITPGSLPKGLHKLNLSRNKISTIEGLRELTRLRVLDLSYNRITRIGHGLANCMLIKELYLAGNKISDVEGLHRLLKLTVLDLSFNKIATTKAMGQLVGNYNSLLALSLVGNPIQRNLSDDQLHKAVCGLLPKLVYLNKQTIKPQRAREVIVDSVAKAALRDNTWSSHKKTAKVSHRRSDSTNGSRSKAGHRSRNSSKNVAHQAFPRRSTPSSLSSVSWAAQPAVASTSG